MGTARRLLHDTTLAPEDRAAGLLVLLYAQWPSAMGDQGTSTWLFPGGQMERGEKCNWNCN